MWKKAHCITNNASNIRFAQENKRNIYYTTCQQYCTMFDKYTHVV